MRWSPCLVRSPSLSGEVCFELGHPLLDEYSAFVAGRARPEHGVGRRVRPEDVLLDGGQAADVMAFIRSRRAGDGANVVRIDGAPGVSSRTIRRRLWGRRGADQTGGHGEGAL